jgi:hypothetical protein
MFLVIRVGEHPIYFSKPEKKLIYNSVCDVECSDCGKVLYSQPYDMGTKLMAI